jgi:hypothetical protein
LAKRNTIGQWISKLRNRSRDSSGKPDDIVSSNSKAVLYGLFALVGFAVLMYAIIADTKYNPDAWTKERTPTPVASPNGERRVQQLEQLNTVYVAAISGSLALGGTLISQLWGRSGTGP